jgi:hypothetical protein
MVRDLGPLKSVIALVLAVVAAATVNAQVVAVPPPPPGHCTGGPFSLTDKAVFYLGLHDTLPAPSMKVTLRFYNANGSEVASRTVTLRAQRATTLEFHGSGVFWAQASFDRLANASPGRRTFGRVELFDVDGFKAVNVVCFPNDNVPSLPDPDTLH